MNDPLANALSQILNSERIAKDEVCLKPRSSVLKRVLEIMNDEGYVGSSTDVEDGKGGIIRLSLLGRINKCGVIKPRFSIKRDGYEKFEKRFLPAKGFGLLIVSTNKGMMTHEAAKQNGLGGRLIAYVY